MFILYFCSVLFSRQNIKKIFSGTLLIVLLIVHSIKLLHTHSYCNFYSAKEIHGSYDKISSSEESKLSPDCEICNYQITKDTDHSFYLADAICKIERQHNEKGSFKQTTNSLQSYQHININNVWFCSKVFYRFF